MKKVMFNNSELSGSFGQENTPIGTILMYGGTRLPFGFLWCNGSAVSRTVYADLFNAIGTAFGSGDGSTTFNLPDYRGRFPQGADGDLGQTKQAGLPNIKGSIRVRGVGSVSPFNNDTSLVNNSLYNDGTYGSDYSPATLQAQGTSLHLLKIDASRNNSIYKDNCNTVQPPAQTCNFIIKFCKAIAPAQEQFIDDSVVSAEKTFSSAKISTIGELKNYTTNIATTPITAERNGIAFVYYNPPTSSAASNVTIKRVSGSNTDNFSEYTTLGLQLRVIIPLKKGDIISEISKTNASYVNTEIIYF